MSHPAFAWFSRASVPPGRWDLRLLGWDLVSKGERTVPAVLDWRAAYRAGNWRDLVQRQAVLVVGVEDSETRAELLAAGFGEALPMQVALVELAARLLRLEGAGQALPRRRRVGPVMLDLLHRDGAIDGKRLGLHPREFALLWRLAETPRRRVTRRELLADVWRLEHMPETNSLEVHVSRLRAKLAISGASWLVETDPQGGYRIGTRPGASFRAFSSTRREMVDSASAMGNGGA